MLPRIGSSVCETFCHDRTERFRQRISQGNNWDAPEALSDRDAQFVCDKAELSAGLARFEDPVRHSLATWTGDCFFQAIEIRIANGSGTYALRF